MYINEHVARRLQEELSDVLSVAWVVQGHQRSNDGRQGRVNRAEGRALIGFLDGTSNLDPRHSLDDARLVFVDPTAVGTLPAIAAAWPAKPLRRPAARSSHPICAITPITSLTG